MELNTFNKHYRPRLLKKLTSEKVELLIIGGGIAGACIFRDAAIRGIKVALVEAGDFSSGTSSRSSKLIHGGLRYLKSLAFRLVRESCGERNLHIRLNKRLVKPIPFIIPVYKNQGESRILLRLGMIAYDIISGFKNYHIHKLLSREQTLENAPGIQSNDLCGSFLYYDATVSDNRWTLETIKDGVRFSGTAINYCPVIGLLKEDDKIIGVKIKENLTGTEYTIHSECVVNATGIFSDAIRQMDQPNLKTAIKLSKGTHLVFDEADIPLNVSMAFHSPIDGRPLFLLKLDGRFLYGTSDDWDDGDPHFPKPNKKEIDYLLKSLRQFMPEAKIDRKKIQFSYSGFRPLIHDDKADKNPSNVTREYRIEISDSRLISVLGGKLTTARITATRVLRFARKQMRKNGNRQRCKTHKIAIGGTNKEIAEGLAYWVKQCPRLKNYFKVLFQRYGKDAHNICAKALSIYLGNHPNPTAKTFWAELQYVCRNEMVCTIEDLMERRAGYLNWNPKKRLERLLAGGFIIKKELGLKESEYFEQVENYKKYLNEFHAIAKLGHLESQISFS
jgi:glycerol-3-phosphate dehydrogenase